MTITLPAARSGGNHTGQATHIEQARAQAEVLAAVEAAKRWPRDEDACEERMKKACVRQVVADKAFWAFPRSGENLTGPSIHLAVTLAGIWGNVQYGVVELSRDAVRRESEMLAVAWDLESNVRPTTTFIVPHVRDTKSGKRDLTDMRDVYENNANMGARRVREMIFRVLPDWYTETAEDICRATLEQNEKPIEQQRSEIGKALVAFNVTKEMIEAKVGKAWDETTGADMAILRIVAKSIKRGEATVREQFPPHAESTKVVTAAAVAAAKHPPAAPEQAPPVEPAVAGDGQPDAPAETAKPARGRGAKPAPAPSSPDPADLPAEETKAYHDQQHPRLALDGSVETAERRLDGSCGICETGDEQ